MAVLALAGAGALAGGAIGSAVGFASVGASIGWAVGGLVGNMLFGPRPPSVEGPRLGDLSVSTSTYGAPIPIVYGTVRLAGNIIWATPIKETQVSRRVRVGKGGGRRQTVTEYQYHGNWAVAFCEGPIDEVIRIWFDSHLVYDTTTNSQTSVIPGLIFRVYKGTETQLPDPLIEQNVGATNAVPFRGLFYIVFENVPLAKVGNRIPSVSVEVTKNVVTTFEITLGSSVNPNPLTPPFSNFGLGNDWEKEKSVYPLESPSQIGAEIIDWVSMKRYRVQFETIPNQQMTLTCVDAYDGLFIARAGRQTSDRVPFGTWDYETGKLLGYYGSVQSVSTLNSNWEAISGNNDGHGLIVRVWTQNGPEYYAVAAIYFNDVWIHKIPSGPYITGSTVSNSGRLFPIPSNLHRRHYLCRGEEREGESDFWFFYTLNYDNPVYLMIFTIKAGAGGGQWFGVGVSAKTYEFPLSALGFTNITTLVSTVFRFCFFDRATNSVILDVSHNGFSRVVKINNKGQILWSKDTTNTYTTTNHYSAQSVFDDNRVALLARPLSQRAYQLNIDTGELTDHFLPSSLWQTQQNLSEIYLLPHRKALGYRTQSDNFLRLRYPFNSGSGTPLSSIVSDLCQRAGLTSSQIDVSSLTDTVRGFLVSRPSSIRSCIEPLAAAYNFDAVERGSQIVFRKRGGSTVATISYDQIIAENEQIIEETRAQDAELPRSLSVRYIDQDRVYEIGTQSWSRPLAPTETVFSVQRSTLDLPIVMTASDTKSIARRLVLSAWRERTRYRFSVTQRHLQLEPTDPVLLTRKDGSSQRVRIISTRVRQDFGQDIEAVEEEGFVPASVSADSGTGTQVPFIPSGVLTKPHAPELPLMGSGDTGGTGLRFYIAASSEAGRNFAPTVAKLQEGTSFVELATLIENAPWGIITSAIPEPQSYWTWDRSTVLRVVVQSEESEFVTASELEVLNGANTAVLYDDSGRVEIIQFATVTPISPGIVDLSNLLRGRYGTEDAGAFPVGANIVLFGQEWISSVAPVSSLNSTRRFLFSPVSSSVARREVRYVVKGRAEQPWAPVHIRGTRNPSNDLTITWVRRTRFGGELIDGIGTVPLHEANEAYDVEIRNMADTTTLRTFSNLSSPTVTYTAAQQTTDGLTPGDPVRVRVYQLSAIVGRGRMGSAIV